MNTKEFIKKVEELGYHHNYDENDKNVHSVIEIYNEDDEYCLAIVYKYHMYSFKIGNSLWAPLPEKYIKKELFDLIVEYAKTPIEERGEEKKYYLKHRWLRCLGGCALLHESTKFHTFVLMGGFGEVPKDYKMKFTQKEIDEIKEKYNTDLSDFVMVEV